MKKIFAQYRYISQNFAVSFALLALRLLTGIAFIIHGWPKIQGPFSWMPMFAPVPGIFQALAAVAEFGGGICLVLGVLTPLVGLGLVATMTVAVGFLAMQGLPFIAAGSPSYELPLVYLAVSVLILVAGPGRFSIDHIIAGKLSGNSGTSKI